MKEEAVEECKGVMEQIHDIYVDADNGNASNVVIEENTETTDYTAFGLTGCF